MTALEAWVNTVQQIVPGAPETLIHDVVRQAAIEFALSTKVDDYSETIQSVVGQATYDLTIPTGNVLIEVHRVFYATKGELDLIDEADLDANEPTWATKQQTPEYYLQDDDDTIRLQPKPAVVDEDIKVWAYIRPAEDATTLEDKYWNQYKDPIGWLASALLLEMPQSQDRPWGDGVRARTYRAMYLERHDRILSRGPRHQHTQLRRRAKRFLW